jgi:hypothetical protein
MNRFFDTSEMLNGTIDNASEIVVRATRCLNGEMELQYEIRGFITAADSTEPEMSQFACGLLREFKRRSRAKCERLRQWLDGEDGALIG